MNKFDPSKWTVVITSDPYCPPPPPLASDSPIYRHHKRLMQTRAIIQVQAEHTATQMLDAFIRTEWLMKRVAERGFTWPPPIENSLFRYGPGWAW